MICYNNKYYPLICESLELVDEGIIFVNEFDDVVFMNNFAEKILELKFEPGYKLDDIYNPVQSLDDSNLIRNFSNLITNKHSNEKKLSCRNGKVITILEKLKEIKLEEESFRIIQFKNIESLKNLEEKTIYSSNFYLKILENFPALICRSNKDDHFNYFNSTWLDFTGDEIEENILKRWFDKIHSEDKGGFEDLYKMSVENKKEFTSEIRILNKNQEYRWVYFYFKPNYNLENEFEGYLGSGIDIHERRLSEEKAIIAMDEANRANKAKSLFLSNMTHELRTPLNGIIGMCEALLDTKIDENQEELLTVQKQCAKNLLELINSILDISKIEAGKLNVDCRPIDIKKFLKEFAGFQKVLVESKKLSFELEIDEKIPEKISTDKLKVKQIITNLIANSTKFTTKGFVKLKAEYISENDEIKIIVEDSGIGIEEKNFEMIFKNFQQVDNSFTRKFEGTGLGLSICKKFVEILGGKIWLSSKLNEGTSFYFTIPVIKNKVKI